MRNMDIKTKGNKIQTVRHRQQDKKYKKRDRNIDILEIEKAQTISTVKSRVASIHTSSTTVQ